MVVSSNLVKLNKLKIVPREVERRYHPMLCIKRQRTLTRLAVSEGADWPKAWLRMRTRLDVSAEVAQACPATGFGSRYRPMGVKQDSVSGRQNISNSVARASPFLAILLTCCCHTPYIY